MKSNEFIIESTVSEQEKIDKKFMSFLRTNGIRATKKSLADGDVQYSMKGSKKLVVVSDKWDKFVVTDDIANKYGLQDLAGVKEFFKRYNASYNKEIAKTPKIVDRPVYD